MDFAPGATGFDIGEDAFEVADAVGKGVHFAEAVVDFFELIANGFKGVPESLFEGGV